MIAYLWLGIFCLCIGLFIEKKSVAKKNCKYYDAMFVAYKQEWQSIASQILCEKKCQFPDRIIQQGDMAYIIVDNNQQLTVYPLNNEKTLNISRRQYQFLMQEFQHERTVYKVIGTTISIYHHLNEPFDNCILLIKRRGISQLAIKR